MTSAAFDGLLDRFLLASGEFERILRSVRPGQWTLPTPCTDWNVRQLVHHMARGNLNYLLLLHGGHRTEFLRLRETDAPGDSPAAAYAASVRQLADAYGRSDALCRILDYPLGPLTGRQALAVRTADSTVHTWDLATALGLDDTLHPALVAWLDEHLATIYAGLPETPVDPDSTHRFFAAPDDRPTEGPPTPAPSRQTRLLRTMGRSPKPHGTPPGSPPAFTPRRGLAQ
ncbi:TIGR03086 family metal-binding protein [Streptomyces sp. CBMA123]|uniref:TIGR03086 family metal-binding protein n=1 Tax=Streptomyces sp. CBMA123 TaxID=1896313 RepID=UPI001661C72C|nr:TIGR03086 family metal-binding protein [Streptomyces sp. CBMA123]MBD0691733.1 TIGR03086 family protein [Streptomyces sp. CBMA123]